MSRRVSQGNVPASGQSRQDCVQNRLVPASAPRQADNAHVHPELSRSEHHNMPECDLIANAPLLRLQFHQSPTDTHPNLMDYVALKIHPDTRYTAECAPAIPRLIGFAPLLLHPSCFEYAIHPAPAQVYMLSRTNVAGSLD